jgi:isoquinoline 1-oxidoreductase alpha subunit
MAVARCLPEEFTMARLQVNGQARDIEVPDDMPLLWALRDELGMTGSKFGCGVALCGACTVHMDGAPVRACITPVSTAAGHAITTIEGLQADRVGQVVQRAWLEQNVAQCGYCQAGQIMTAVGLLKSTPAPSEQQIEEAMSGNICRCGTYPRIRAAVQQAAQVLAQGDQ